MASLLADNHLFIDPTNIRARGGVGPASTAFSLTGGSATEVEVPVA